MPATDRYRVVAVDVDCTVVRTDILWWDWLQKKIGRTEPFPEDCVKPYNIGEMFDLPDGLNPHDFWKQRDLYDGLEPIQGSVDALRYAYDSGYKVAFVSVIDGDHGKSKYAFLKRHFPFLSGVLYTREKHLVGADVLIDDRRSNLHRLNVGCTPVQYTTNYKQDFHGHIPGLMYLSAWDDLKTLLKI